MYTRRTIAQNIVYRYECVIITRNNGTTTTIVRDKSDFLFFQIKIFALVPEERNEKKKKEKLSRLLNS